MPVSVSIILDSRRLKKTGKYPVKLQVINDRNPKRYQTIYDLTQEDFNNLSASRISEKKQKIRDSLKLIQRNAEDAANSINPFSYEDFEKDYVYNNPLFRQRKYIKNVLITTKVNGDDFNYAPFYKKMPFLQIAGLEPGTIGFTYRSYIKKLIQENRIGTAFSYHTSYQSLNRFRENVLFRDITVSFLHQYEQWAKLNGISKTTIGIYLRSFRAVYNEAIADGLAKRDAYPFGKRKYQIPGGRNIKKALTLDHIADIFNYVPECAGEQWGKDYWLFFYLGNGMNPKDAALLRYKNIRDGFIVFYRAKIENTARTEPKPITVFLTEEILEIIERQGNKDKNPDNYIFPILEPGLSPLQEFDRIKNFIRLANKWIKRICTNLEFSAEVSTIVSRHTCATVLQNLGASTEFIQETLGHMEKRTTENYMGGFLQETKKQFAAKLIPIKKENAVKQVS